MDATGDFSRYRPANRHSAGGCLALRRVLPLAAAAYCVLLAMPVRADTALAGNPGYDRPGYGFTPAVLGAGDITLEQGLPDASHSVEDGIGQTQYNADSLLRIGLGGPLELQLGRSVDSWLRTSGAGTNASVHGHGDSIIGLKFALPEAGSAFSWGLLGSVEFTDGSPALRNNRNQYLLGAQFNLQADARNSLGAYVQEVRAGAGNAGTLALSDNYAWTPALTLYAEGVLQHTPGQGAGSLAGGGLAWMAGSRVQVDAGMDRRLGGYANRWQANLGVSVYFGH